MRRTIPLALTFIVGMYPVFAFFVPHSFVSELNQRLDTWLMIVAAFALPLGVVNLVSMNLEKIKRRKAGWPYAVVLLVGMVVMAYFGVIGVITGRYTGFHPTFETLFENWVSPLQATMFSLLAFYVASAAYRAFRARNLEATILLVAAIVVMMGRIPFGDMLTGGRMTPVSEWLMNRPNAAAQRGIIIGAALGAASMSIRVILGIERTYLGKGQD
jgi:hypothetical protein